MQNLKPTHFSAVVGRVVANAPAPLLPGEQEADYAEFALANGLRAIGCETIYAFIYRTAQKAEALWRYLTRRHKRRRPRRARASRDTIKDRASIHDRPKTIESRGEAGHWEGDLIICKCTRPVLVLHERKSRVTLAARLTGKTAAETISAMLAVFGRIDPHLRRSITFDNDTAFAQHGLLRTMRDMTTWFCDAYASWQKGGVENANTPRAIVKAAHPKDAIEDLLTRDVIDLSWEVLRLRRLKAGLLRGAIGSSIYQVMCRLGYEDEYAWKLAANWAAERKAAQKEVAAALQKAQLTMEDVMAETLEGKIDSFERFDRMLASSEARRNNALREIERHRAALGAAVRQAVDEIQDAEFRDVDTGEVGGAPPP